MTDKPETAAIRAQMEALEGFTPGPWTWKNDVNDEYSEWSVSPGVLLADGPDGTPSGDEIDRANARLIAAAPEMHATILTLCDEVERLRAFIADFAEMKIEAIYPPPDPRDPCEVGDPVTDYMTIEALQEDARAALGQPTETDHDRT